MKSAGKPCSKISWCSNGKWCWANGIAPESNHTSITSGTRLIGFPQIVRSEARWEAVLEDLLVLEWKVVLGERHCARVKPHVDHLRHSPHRLSADRQI